jgi:hypothetical protein
MRIIGKLRHWARNVKRVGRDLSSIEAKVTATQVGLTESSMLSARLLIDHISARGRLTDISEAEFKVFSQCGEDGIIQYLIRQTKIPPTLHTFVEFGVESYVEANTRFLLMNNNWRGLVMDGSTQNISAIQNTDLYWKYDLTAVAAFVDAENINGLLQSGGFGGEIGLLSIDIDGNDYWIWDRIDVVTPIILIIEYNSLFGSQRAVTVPYDRSFRCSEAHYSNLYFGCSLKALELLSKRKGYALVGSNSTGQNAFFVRRDSLNGLPELTAEEAYVESRFRESRDRSGRLNYLSGKARPQAIAEMAILDLERNTMIQVADLLN